MLLFINFHYLTLSHRTFSHLVFFFFPQHVRFRSYALILFLTHSGKGHNSISLSSSGTAAFKKWLHTLSWQPKHGKREINLTQRPRIKKKSVVVRGGGWGGGGGLNLKGWGGYGNKLSNCTQILQCAVYVHRRTTHPVCVKMRGGRGREQGSIHITV